MSSALASWSNLSGGWKAVYTVAGLLILVWLGTTVSFAPLVVMILVAAGIRFILKA